MGLVGLANTVAIEGANSNIHCNVIVPTAASRLTEDILPPEVFAELKPELIAPVVVSIIHFFPFQCPCTFPDFMIEKRMKQRLICF